MDPSRKVENFEILKIIFRRISEIFVKYVQFFEIFLRENGFLGQEKFWYFWKMDSFSKTMNRFKKWNFDSVQGAAAPSPYPLLGRVIAFKWPGNPGHTIEYPCNFYFLERNLNQKNFPMGKYSFAKVRKYLKV